MFWALIARGWMSGALGLRGTIIALGLWLAGYISLPFVPYGAALFPPFVALVDIGLVFAIFKGDVRIM